MRPSILSQLLAYSTLNNDKTHIHVLPWLPCAIVSDAENIQKLTRTNSRSGSNIILFRFLVIDALWEKANYAEVQYLTIYLQKERIAKWCQKVQRRRQNGNISAKWQNWLKAHLSSWGISSPRGFTHRKSRTSSKFGTCKSQTWLSSTNRSIDWEKRYQETFHFFPSVGISFLFYPHS